MLLPRLLRIPPCHDPSDTPLGEGGFANVWRSEYNGRDVAVKVLKTYLKSDLVKIRNVGPHIHSEVPVGRLMLSV